MVAEVSMKEELVKKSNVGKSITIVLHNITLSGKIVDATEEHIKIDTDISTIPIKLDAIEAYFFVEDGEGNGSEEQEKKRSRIFERELAAFRTGLEMSGVPKVISYAVFKKEAQMKGEVSILLHQIMDIIDYAYKIRETSADSDRIRRAYSLIVMLPQKYENDRNVRYLKGILQVMLRRNKEAAENFALVGDYESALAVVPVSEKRNRLEYAAKALENNMAEEFALNLLLAEPSVAVPILRKKLSNVYDIKRQKEREIFLSAAIVYREYKGAAFVLQWPNDLELVCEENLAYLKAVYELKTQNQLSVAHTPPESGAVKKAVSDRRKKAEVPVYHGKIMRYIEEKRCGFISEHNVPDSLHKGNVFFYAGQVNDDELRKRLFSSCGSGVKVTFTAGLNPVHQNMAADNIKLAGDNSVVFDEVWVKEGSIIEYNPFEEYGRILYSNEELLFRLDEVRDPLLRTFLTTSTGTDCKVKFRIIRRANGKKYAANIVSGEPFSDEMVQEWVQNRNLSEKELESWKNRPFQPQDAIGLSHLGVYQPLEPYTGSIEKKADCVETKEQRPEGNYVLGDAEEILRQVENATRLYMAKAASAEQLNEAVERFKKVLAWEDILYQNKKLDTVVFGLANIYLRRGEYQEAIAVLEKYQNDARISKEKILNVLIQVYDKSKVDSGTLRDLYREGIQISQK